MKSTLLVIAVCTYQGTLFTGANVYDGAKITIVKEDPNESGSGRVVRAADTREVFEDEDFSHKHDLRSFVDVNHNRKAEEIKDDAVDVLDLPADKVARPIFIRSDEDDNGMPNTNAAVDGAKEILTGEKDKNVTGEKGENVTGEKGENVTGEKDKNVSGEKGENVTGEKDKNVTGERGENVNGEKDKNVTGEKGENVTGEKGENVTGEKDKNVTGEKGENVTGEKDKNVTGEKGENVTGEKGENVTGEKDKNVTGEKGENVTGEENENVTGEKTKDILAKWKESGFGQSEPKDLANLFGTNQHHNYPSTYKDFGRRHTEWLNKLNDEEDERLAEETFDNTIQNQVNVDNDIVPVKARPELVLAVVKESLLRQALRPVNVNEYKQPSLLRSGDYWNDVWKENVSPKVLRNNGGQEKQRKELRIVKASVSPGTTLHKLISTLRNVSPRLLYVINKEYSK